MTECKCEHSSSPAGVPEAPMYDLLEVPTFVDEDGEVRVFDCGVNCWCGGSEWPDCQHAGTE